LSGICPTDDEVFTSPALFGFYADGRHTFPMRLPRLGRLALAALAVPHELGHALPAVLARLPYSITLLPEWEGTTTPLGQFDAEVGPDTSPWLIRAVAVAPFPLFVALAALVRVTTTLPRPAAIAVVLLCSWWASLSGGDLAVAANPEEVKEAGAFLVTVAGWETAASDVLTVLTVVLVAVVTFA
jgi:hypothetical protein